MNKEFIFELLEWIAEEELWGDMGMIYWNEELDFYVLCNDVFAWGCSDAEDITPETFPILKKAVNDLNNFREKEFYGFEFGTILYCSRVRKMRPQGAFYQEALPLEIWDFFDECGEARPEQMGNPIGTGELNEIYEYFYDKGYDLSKNYNEILIENQSERKGKNNI